MNPLNKASVSTARLKEIKSEINKERGFFGCIFRRSKTQGQKVRNALKSLAEAGKMRTVYADGILENTTSPFEQTLLRVNRFSPARPKSDGSLGDASEAMDKFDKKIASAQKQYEAYRVKEEAFCKEFATFCDDLKLLPEERIAILDDLLSQKNEDKGSLATNFRKGSTKELTQRLTLHSIKYNELVRVTGQSLYKLGLSLESGVEAIKNELLGTSHEFSDSQVEAITSQIRKDLKQATTLPEQADPLRLTFDDEAKIKKEAIAALQELDMKRKEAQEQRRKLTEKMLDATYERRDAAIETNKCREEIDRLRELDPTNKDAIKFHMEMLDLYVRTEESAAARLDRILTLQAEARRKEIAADTAFQTAVDQLVTEKGTRLKRGRQQLVQHLALSETLSTRASSGEPGSLGNSFSSQHTGTPVSAEGERRAFSSTESTASA